MSIKDNNKPRSQYVKQKLVELLAALPITTVGRDYQARQILLHYRQNA